MCLLLVYFVCPSGSSVGFPLHASNVNSTEQEKTFLVAISPVSVLEPQFSHIIRKVHVPFCASVSQ